MKNFLLNNTIESDGFPFSLGEAIIRTEGFEIHTHDYCELIIITSGKGLHTAEGRTFPVGRGDIFIINQGQSHCFSRSRDLIMYNIGYMEEIKGLKELTALPGVMALFELEPKSRKNSDFKNRFHANPDQLEKISKIIKEMEKEMRSEKPGYQTIFRNLFINLIILLGRNYSDKGFIPGRNLTKLARCIRQIEENYTEEINLKSLADENGLSYPHFIKTFGAVYGTSPLQYILKMRISRATELLETTDLNITEIGFECGFGDSNYFSRLFRKRMGVSPGKFRKSGL
ncbi:MAG: AraC family transcriptional regulator [Spirochaetales bacterium]|nr:AraC family transcriptional regulator [Spirochaetales bacterium]